MYLYKPRWLVLTYLTCIMGVSVIYVFWMCQRHSFSAMITVSTNLMFNEIYRRPFGPMGYYAFGVYLSILYFEYSQAVSNRELRKRPAYQFLTYIGRAKSRQLSVQLIGLFMVLFVVFIRFSSFGGMGNSLA